jgi:hypothetical protein
MRNARRQRTAAIRQLTRHEAVMGQMAAEIRHLRAETADLRDWARVGAAARLAADPGDRQAMAMLTGLAGAATEEVSR